MHVAHVSLTNDLEDPTNNTLVREVLLEWSPNFVNTQQEIKPRADQLDRQLAVTAEELPDGAMVFLTRESACRI